MAKIDYKKDYKDYYIPKKKPSIIDIPSMNFITIQGKGDPNGEEFGLKVEALYSFSYAVRMSHKGSNPPENYYEYVVFPLEAVWDIDDKSMDVSMKENYVYKAMIRQPDFLNKELSEKFLEVIKKKKPNIYLDELNFETIEEGLTCQILHMGSYDTEKESFEVMENYCKESGYTRISKVHREIYLSDPRKIDSSKLKTVLRFSVEKV